MGNLSDKDPACRRGAPLRGVPVRPPHWGVCFVSPGFWRPACLPLPAPRPLALEGLEREAPLPLVAELAEVGAVPAHPPRVALCPRPRGKREGLDAKATIARLASRSSLAAAKFAATSAAGPNRDVVAGGANLREVRTGSGRADALAGNMSRRATSVVVNETAALKALTSVMGPAKGRHRCGRPECQAQIRTPLGPKR